MPTELTDTQKQALCDHTNESILPFVVRDSFGVPVPSRESLSGNTQLQVCGGICGGIWRKTEIEDEITSDKALRRDIDAIIQRVKRCPTTRERSLTITKLQEAVMWLGMDLKRINEANPALSTPPKTVRQCAEEAYARYGSVTDFKNFRGDPMPAFADLGEKIQAAWEAAVSVQETPSSRNPYPNSKDPSNTKIEPTADGLKL